MRFFNWAESFKETPTCEDILKKVRNIEIQYWIYLLLSVIIALWGVLVVLCAPANNLKLLLIGLFLAIDGCLQITLIKIWAHIKLSMYWIIWDRNNRIEAELTKLEAQDL